MGFDCYQVDPEAFLRAASQAIDERQCPACLTNLILLRKLPRMELWGCSPKCGFWFMVLHTAVDVTHRHWIPQRSWRAEKALINSTRLRTQSVLSRTEQ